MSDDGKAVTNPERIALLQQHLKENELDALICALPAHVLMMTGYWPVVGKSIAVVTTEGEVAILAPEDEEELTAVGWATAIETYPPNSLERLTTPVESAAEGLRRLARKLKVHCARIGYEFGPASEPASYAAMNIFGCSMVNLLRTAAPSAALAPADDILQRLTTTKTPLEIARIRRSCSIAQSAFAKGREHLRAGMDEQQIAVLFRAGLSTGSIASSGVQRADGFAYCMSGPNSAKAFGAYARSRYRHLEPGDFVLLHCNSYADGYWTDITRTYVLGKPDERQQVLYEAVMQAHAAALREVRSGAKTADVDHAAREVLRQRGLADAFKHSTGHGVGFAAISANAHPRLHPSSQETLAAGMVFNIEPAVYIDGYGGIRHCDMVAITDAGTEILTPFHASLPELTIH
ncbi:MAG TPA: Xaa-Pro peptidase family protein [Clostridia bacterium]|nr:Xaa-Pro peptidase family protein [Clostridia bacterium]